MVEDLALWCSLHTDAALYSQQQSARTDRRFLDAQFDCPTWIRRHGVPIRFVYRCDDVVRAHLCSFLALPLMTTWKVTQSGLCVSAYGYEAACVHAWVMHMQHIWLLVGVCLWEWMWTLRRYCWIYPRTSSVLWVSLQCGASCQIDRPLLKNLPLGHICTELMKPRSSHIESNISTYLAVA